MIESYDFGRIVVNGRKFGSDLIIFPDRVNGGWWRKEGRTLLRSRVGVSGKFLMDV